MKLLNYPSAFLLLLLLLPPFLAGVVAHDYKDALAKSILFFEGQRSGWLPKDQRVKWRGDSALKDGENLNVDLVGGYYDAGDNMKFHFPMAFSTTMLAWSVVDFGGYMPWQEREQALSAVRWGTDYLLKTVSELPNRIFVQVGEPVPDHNCWQRPEDMGTPRTAYAVNAPSAASDLAGEIAAALAAASIAFKSPDPSYSRKLLKTASTVFHYADSYRGRYTDNPSVRDAICPFYCSVSGYEDELLWGAAWMRRATGKESYLQYLVRNREALGNVVTRDQFGWDNKYGGLNILVAKEVLDGKRTELEAYKGFADELMCRFIPESGVPYPITYTKGGLIYKEVSFAQFQHATTFSFLLLVYADYLAHTSQPLNCNGAVFSRNRLRSIAKQQVDYILGDNPMKMSYMVGYGKNYPAQIHHRASSLPSIFAQPNPIDCNAGWKLFDTPGPNPNPLVGALTGGPGQDDNYVGGRDNAPQAEPTTYINAPFVGVLSFFTAYPNFR